MGVPMSLSQLTLVVGAPKEPAVDARQLATVIAALEVAHHETLCLVPSGTSAISRAGSEAAGCRSGEQRRPFIHRYGADQPRWRT